MVDIDAAPLQITAKIIGEDLHITRQHHDICSRLLDQVAQRLFGGGFIVLRHRDVMEGKVVPICVPFGVCMV